jgi:hypothetical protein
MANKQAPQTATASATKRTRIGKPPGLPLPLKLTLNQNRFKPREADYRITSLPFHLSLTSDLSIDMRHSARLWISGFARAPE